MHKFFYSVFAVILIVCSQAPCRCAESLPRSQLKITVVEKPKVNFGLIWDVWVAPLPQFMQIPFSLIPRGLFRVIISPDFAKTRALAQKKHCSACLGALAKAIEDYGKLTSAEPVLSGTVVSQNQLIANKCLEKELYPPNELCKWYYFKNGGATSVVCAFHNNSESSFVPDFDANSYAVVEAEDETFSWNLKRESSLLTSLLNWLFLLLSVIINIGGPPLAVYLIYKWKTRQ